MRFLPNGASVSGGWELFVERRESLSIAWRKGSAVIRWGTRNGAGMRRSDGSGRVTFRSVDQPEAGLRLALEMGLPGLADVSSEFSTAPGLHQASVPRTAMAYPSGLPQAGLDRDAELVSGLEYLEAVSLGVLSEVAARDLQADLQVYRQGIHVETADSEGVDERRGVRLEIRAAIEGEARVRVRLADRTIDRLSARCPPRAVGTSLGKNLLLRLEELAHPSGSFPVVFAAGTCGPLLHELGHLFEDDHARLPTAPFRKGDRVASPDVTIVDDPRACDGRGSYEIDDEGVRGTEATLVAEGVFNETLDTIDRRRDRTAGGTGHGRRASFRDLPLPRMACTFLRPGRDDAASIVSGTTRGIFVSSLRAGDLDPGSGDITLIIDEGFLIEGGTMTRPVADCLIATSARELLSSIDAIGSDLHFDHGAGDCVKRDQILTVIVGMPTIRARVVKVIAP